MSRKESRQDRDAKMVMVAIVRSQLSFVLINGASNAAS